MKINKRSIKNSSATLLFFIGFFHINQAQQISIYNDLTTGDLKFDLSGSELMRLNAGGLLGIGTNNPSSLLSIGNSSQFQVNNTGNIIKINNITTSFPATQGGANTYLTNDGSGNLSWVPVAGSGTVTSFSANNLLPLFTTSVTTPTTTPALSFTISNAAAYTLLGNNTAGSAVPTYFTPLLESSLFANQGTTTGVLHGNAAGNPSWGQIVNADMTNMAANTIKGNNSGAAASPVDITLGTDQVLGRLSGDIISIPLGTAANTIALGDHTHTDLHTRSHSMISTTDHTAGDWMVFYSDGSGNVNELGLGANGEVLKSNGPAIAPTWQPDANGGGTVTSVGSGTGLTGGPITGSGSLSLDYSSTLGSDPTLAADQTVFGTTGLVFEGSTTDANEGLLTVSNPTSDRTWTLPDASGTIALTSDLPAGSALTKTDDTNVTLSLDAGAATSLLNPTSLTLGWTGQLAVARGGTNGTATPTAGAVAYGTGTEYAFTATGSSGEVLTSNGVGAPSWSTVGDITSVNAGTGLTGGGISGIVTVNAVGDNGLTTNADDIDLGGTLNQATTITQAANSFTIENNGTANTVINLSSTGDFDIQDNGTSVFYVKDDGNVGIATTTPLARLHIDRGTTGKSLELTANNLDIDFRIADRVRITGYLEERALADHLAICDLFLCPMRFKSSSASILQLFRQGKPILVPDLPLTAYLRDEGAPLDLYASQAELQEKAGAILEGRHRIPVDRYPYDFPAVAEAYLRIAEEAMAASPGSAR